MLHPGHLRLLRYASERAERLVVGVISRSHATSTHLFDDDVRLEAVMHLDIVDDAILLREDVAAVVARIRPDIVGKGREHRDRFNAEEAALEQYGGRLVFAPGDSTMDILDIGPDASSRPILDLDGDLAGFIRRRGVDLGRLRGLVEGFESARVWVVGDVIVDDYVECEPLGMSREDASIAVTPVRFKRYPGRRWRSRCACRRPRGCRSILHGRGR